MSDREQTIQYLTQMKRDLHVKREKLLRPLQEVDKDIESVTATLAAVLRSTNQEEKENAVGFPVKKLRGLTHTEALIEIAKYNGGILKAQEAKVIMIGAGVMRNTKNSTHMVHGAIARSEAFERIGRGEYKLKQINVVRRLPDDPREVTNHTVSLFAKPVQ